MSEKYIIISGFNVRDNNRGTAALSYGSVSFLYARRMLMSGDTLLNIRPFKNFFKHKYHHNVNEVVEVDGQKWNRSVINVFIVEWWLLLKLGIKLPWSSFAKALKQTTLVAAINGGDGFSDIYDTATFKSRLPETMMAMKAHIPFVLLPQTIGPFKYSANRKIATQILHHAKQIFVRDTKFVDELDQMKLSYVVTKDLSFYMQPQPVDFDIKPHSVGINVSGLAYSNNFRTLQGQFSNYPFLIDLLIRQFQTMGISIYLIPHSYNYTNPETNNDDVVAMRSAYERLQSKEGVHMVDKDLISPQVKYVISRMSFFVGTRMHANFAAIYTNVPVYGLAYSYKFEGAFSENGIHNSTSMINNLSISDCESVVEKIIIKYKEISEHPIQ